MDKIDSLIKTLTEFKEELEKASKDPKLAPKEVKIKQLQSQIDAGTYKPDPKKIADKMLKEELTCSENGQWDIKKSIYNAGTHPMKGRESKTGIPGKAFEPDHSADYDTNFKDAHAHYKNMGMSLSDDKIHNILKTKLKKK
jgi:hypothetical protein